MIRTLSLLLLLTAPGLLTGCDFRARPDPSLTDARPATVISINESDRTMIVEMLDTGVRHQARLLGETGDTFMLTPGELLDPLVCHHGTSSWAAWPDIYERPVVSVAELRQLASQQSERTALEATIERIIQRVESDPEVARVLLAQDDTP